MIDEEDFGKYLWTAGFKDPELIIRTSGEMRTSNFCRGSRFIASGISQKHCGRRLPRANS